MLTLHDIHEITQLKYRYFHAVDDHDWEAFGSLFADDARFDVSRAVDKDLTDPAWHDGAVFSGRDNIVAFVVRTMSPLRSIHHGYSPLIREAGPGRAKVRWSMEDILLREEDGVQRPVLHGYGTYIEDCIKSGEEWLYERVELRRTLVLPLA
ncbi:nuclear transport factor 2 family protein [Novosphingobium sp. PASSN1]|uniref:nuclear transport factor 2 family protein n=1 Tax=Novosphingobium sp. PASSN1 TaxID=2015561 RepID=UPI000BCC76C5|nr:nuclear transport factor 2 family protein [Novosphingobium sp. PASSN1]OYU34781.1 MAG: hypothetical protein CFE35_12880 [Novosphingobium sp. PASSN1]